MTEKETLLICMGSACHQLGVYEALPQFQKLLTQYDLDDTFELKGAFCLGPCSDGIVVHYQDQVFTHISPENAAQKFREEILPAIENARTRKEPSTEHD